LADGVVLAVFAVAKTVKDNEKNGGDRLHVGNQEAKLQILI
jgi:hypothetical protein